MSETLTVATHNPLMTIPSITITTPAITILYPKLWLLMFLVAVNLALAFSPAPALASTTNYFYLDPKDPSTLFGISDQNGFHYVVPDHLGSPSILLDEEGNVEQVLDYNSYGIERINEINRQNNPSSFTSPFSFTGQRKDPESDLLYFGARYYNPQIGRFTQPDPMIVAANPKDPRFQNALMNPQRLNPYSYAANNPIKYIDMKGEDAVIAINDRWGTITVKADIYIYGQDATAEIAERMQTNIMHEWDRGRIYTDQKTNKTYNVRFDVEVRETEHPIIQRAVRGEDDNTINIDNTQPRAFVNGSGNSGTWRGNNPDPAPHEFGHLLGLDDHYNDTGAESGWTGNIMAERAMQGQVEQRNIDTILAPYMEKHDKRLFKFINKQTTHHIAPRGTFREQ